jgi:hypothetical protein
MRHREHGFVLECTVRRGNRVQLQVNETRVQFPRSGSVPLDRVLHQWREVMTTIGFEDCDVRDD